MAAAVLLLAAITVHAGHRHETQDGRQWETTCGVCRVVTASNQFMQVQASPLNSALAFTSKVTQGSNTFLTISTQNLVQIRAPPTTL